jgi:hypothetical protein
VRSRQGKSLALLAQQLGHATASIRQAAAKGVLDIILNQKPSQSSSLSSSSWQAHVSLVLPAIGHCLIDTDASVRSTGLLIWQAVVAGVSADAKNSNNATAAVRLRPVWPILMAFLASAMNALDRRVRRDSRVVLESAACHFPSLVAPFVAPTLLPALLRLADDPTFQFQNQVVASTTTTTTTTAGARSTAETGKRNRNGRQVWLAALAALLRAGAAGHTHRQRRTLSRGSSSATTTTTTTAPTNGVVWRFTRGTSSPNALLVLSPATTRGRGSTSGGGGGGGSAPRRRHWWKPEAGLGDDYPQPPTTTSSVTASRHATTSTSTTTLLSESLTCDVWRKLRDLLLELLESNNSHETLAVWAEAVQALLLALVSNTTTTESLQLVTQIQGLVLSHETSPPFRGLWMLTLTQLSQALPPPTGLGGENRRRKSSWIPRVVDFLLDEEQRDDDESTCRWQILGHFLEDARLLSSQAGERVVEHLVHNWEEQSLTVAPLLYAVASPAKRVLILQHMVDFIVTPHPNRDENVVFGVYEFVLDQVRNPEAIPSDFMSRFGPIWLDRTLARYDSEKMQRLAFCLLVNVASVQGLPVEILSALGRMCSDSVLTIEPSLSPPVATLVHDGVFGLRRSFALPKFLAFLMDSTAVSFLVQDEPNDTGLHRAAPYLLACGVSNPKILKMLWPLWQTWLEARSIVMNRAAVSFLAVLATDEGSHTLLRDELPADAHHQLLKGLIRIVQSREWSSQSKSWFQPIDALLRAEVWMWEPLLEAVSEDLSSAEAVLLGNCRDLLREQSSTCSHLPASLSGIQRGAQLIEEAAQQGPLKTSALDLSDCVKALIATAPAQPS